MLNLLTLAVFATAVLASPFDPLALLQGHHHSAPQAPGCKVSQYSIPLPVNQTALTVPAGEVPTLITLGRGIQNYTCTSGAWVNIGALANLYDVSCLLNDTRNAAEGSTLTTILPSLAYNLLSYPEHDGPPVAVHHLFIETPGSTTGSTSPEFVGTTNKVVAAKNASLAAPDPTMDVAWLKLTAVEGQGTLAKTVFRVDTYGGQPPPSCSTEGSQLSVQYSAMYWFFS